MGFITQGSTSSHGPLFFFAHSVLLAFMETIQTLIVDDEPLGRERVRTLLAHHPRFSIAAECKNGEEAIAALTSHTINLVFLDIQMPVLSGFDVIQHIGPERMPPVIFVTAYDQHAIQAFTMHAFDYLLKPYTIERFNEALDHATHRLDINKRAELSAKLSQLLGQLSEPTPLRERIAIKDRSKMYFIKTDDIDWIESAGNYVNINANGKKHLLRQTMAGLEAQLNPNHFIRIHRSTIININRILHLTSMMNGEYQVVLKDGTKLSMSRTYKDRLDRFL